MSSSLFSEENEKVQMEAEDEIDLLDLLAVLIKHKLLIFLITIIAALGVLFYSILSLKMPPEKSFLPNYYTSTAKLLVNDEGGSRSLPSDLSGMAGLLGVSIGGGSSYGNLAVELAKSNFIIDRIVEEFSIIERYNIEESPKHSSRIIIKDKMTVEFDPSTKIFSLTFRDIYPEVAMNTVNRTVELLEDRFSNIGVNRNLNQKKLLEEKLIGVNREIIELEEKIKLFQEEYRVISIDQLASSQVQSLAELKGRLIIKELELKTLTQFANINDPMVNRTRVERDNLMQLIKQMEQGGVDDSNIEMGPALSDMPAIALEFSHLRRDLLVQAEIQKILTQELELVKLKVEGEGPIFQVLEFGEIADQKSGPSRGKLCIIVTMAAFFCSIFLSFLLEFYQNLRRDSQRWNKLKDAGKKYKLKI